MQCSGLVGCQSSGCFHPAAKLCIIGVCGAQIHPQNRLLPPERCRGKMFSDVSHKASPSSSKWRVMLEDMGGVVFRTRESPAVFLWLYTGVMRAFMGRLVEISVCLQPLPTATSALSHRKYWCAQCPPRTPHPFQTCLLAIQNGEEWLILLGAVLAFRRVCTAWRDGQRGAI